MADKGEIVEALSPIFPQLSHLIIRNCVDRVCEMFGDTDRGLIIQNCIDLLLTTDPNQFDDQRDSQRNDERDRTRDLPVESVVVFQDEISDNELLSAANAVNIGGNHRRANAVESINSNTSTSSCSVDDESYSSDDGQSEDDDLVYVSAKDRDGKELLFVDDDSQPQIVSPKAKTTVASKSRGGMSGMIDLSRSRAGPVKVTSTTQGFNAKPPSLLHQIPHEDDTIQDTIIGLSTPESKTAPPPPPAPAPAPPPAPPLLPPEPVIVDPIGHALKEVKSLFSDVQDNYLRELLQPWALLAPVQIINNACNHLLENKGYPKLENKPTPKPAEIAVLTPEKVDYFKNYKDIAPPKYRSQCEQLLENEFPMVSVRDIRCLLMKYNYHYAPTKKTLEESLVHTYAISPSPSKNLAPSPQHTPKTPLPSGVVPLKLLKSRRAKRGLSLLQNLELDLQREIDFIKVYKRNMTEEVDRKLALELNEKQYVEEGQTIECGCCYGDAAFEDMVQCLDGHLFCVDCLKNYAKESVFGQGKATLSCMTAECDSTFPMSQLKKTLPSNILAKYEDRLQEESLCLAEMEDLVRCPNCDFAAVVPPDNKVFKCQNTDCAKEICRFCKEDWSEHFGLKCSEIEKKGEKDIRLSYEEKMTMAKIRKCHKCGCEFTKSDGCNKMTCRCGTTQCYVCRKPSISYNHFCQHARDPGKGCTRCKSCSLWTDPSEDDNMAVKQLEREATEAKRHMQDLEDKDESQVPAKKPRIS